MATFEVARARQQDAAAQRVADRTGVRREKIDLLSQDGGLVQADSPERIATRIDRLSRYHSEIVPIAPNAIEEGEPAAMAAASTVLERIINTDDLLGVAYLEAGARAARAVGRVNIRDERGRIHGYGTGSLVSPVLLLTNHHVLPDAATASTSTIEFNYQDGIDGQPLQPRVFKLDPARFFVADEGLDFALVAVAPGPSGLGEFGFNPLIEAEGKAIVGDFVTIVQHPGGERKQVALRENRIVDLPDRFVHYETDTEPGSSGSPVFNDQWEIVALHHASAPAPDDPRTFVNEGVRVSRLLGRLQAMESGLSATQRQLIAELTAKASAMDSVLPTEEPETVVRDTSPAAPSLRATATRPVAGFSEEVRLTVPLSITLHAGDISAAAPEAITIDPDYASREGYDPRFLGSDALEIPLPALADELIPLAATNRIAASDPVYVLRYHHFSLAMNRERRLAFFTAVNIDGSTSLRPQREPDRWFRDPRIGEEEQTNDEVYAGNPLDRGHLVRRLDPAWGSSPATAKLANDDTFHFTNCSPQHEDFNQNSTTWAGLEDYILGNADNRDLRVSVFTGPVFDESDEIFKDLQLPRQFWKVVAMVRSDGSLSATAYQLSQEALIEGLEVAPEEFSYAAYGTFQVPVTRIEELTRLSFGSLRDADPMAALEAERPAIEIERLEQIRL